MHISTTNKPVVLITMGDPSGVGPEIILKSLASPILAGLANFVIIADTGVIEETKKLVNFEQEFSFLKVSDISEATSFNENTITVIDPGDPISGWGFGKASMSGAKKALKCIDVAINIAKTLPGNIKRSIITAPVNKENIAKVHPGFIGHTEYLMEKFSSEFVTMVLKGRKLCVVPVTRHIPIRNVSNALNPEIIEKTIMQVVENKATLSDSEEPVIGVCALNPHCGEGGKIGDEEQKTITPAVENVKKKYKNIIGPISADVVFYKALKKQIDIVISMYHDQCLSPFKMVDFDCGVNITLGLNCVRTSPDHGTAYDIAGKNIANQESMQEAIITAIQNQKI